MWFRHLGTFLAIGALVAVPVELLVPGLIGGRLFAAYDIDAPLSAGAPGPTNIAFGLYVTPVIWSACALFLVGLAEGRAPSVREGLRAAHAKLGGMVLPVLLAGLGAFLALFLLVAPGIYLYVRWFFVVPVVATEGTPRLEALQRSSELVRGSWWRTFGCLLLLTLVAALPFVFLVIAGQVAGYVSGLELMALALEMVGDVVFFPLYGILATLLYFDLRVRTRSTGLLPEA